MENNNISIAFAFDYNFYRQAVVAISSLVSLNSKVGYDIYCIVKSDITPALQKEIKTIIEGKSVLSKVFFIDTGSYFENAYECRGITKAAYYRLMLHRLLDIDKIIYSDVDVLFEDDLTQIYNTEMDSFLIGMPIDPNLNFQNIRKNLEKTYKYWRVDLKNIGKNYHCSGFLIINLKKMREANLDDEIFSLAKREFLFQDMDILNILFSNRQSQVLRVSSRYCFIAKFDYNHLCDDGIISKEELHETLNNPAIIHYAGIKPWNNKSVHMADKWWDYMKQNTPYYSYFKKQYHKLLIKKIIEILKKKFLSMQIKEKNGKKYKILYILGIKIKLSQPSFLKSDIPIYKIAKYHVDQLIKNINLRRK